jgi:hypothetical protein
MLTMDEYKIVDSILPNYLEEGDLIKVKGDIFEIINIIPTHDGWDLWVLDNYDETKIVSVPDDKLVNLVLNESAID